MPSFYFSQSITQPNQKNITNSTYSQLGMVVLIILLLSFQNTSAAESSIELPAGVKHKINEDFWQRWQQRDKSFMLQNQNTSRQIPSNKILVKVKTPIAVSTQSAFNTLSQSSRRDIQQIKARFDAAKQPLLSSIADLPAANTLSVINNYSYLPMILVEINSTAQLMALLELDSVETVYEDIKVFPSVQQSKPLIRQVDLVNAGMEGATTSVVIADTGLDYTHSVFGNCTNVATPASCRVVHAQDFAAEDNALDDNGHGTSVAGIVAEVAPKTNLIALDVFDGGSASSSIIATAIDWAIANRELHNIVALNLSLGDLGSNSSACDTFFNPFYHPLKELREAGVIPVVASGNEGHTNGVSNPACVSAALSVGAVYDSNMGPRNWANCSDSSTDTDQVTCFSNSAQILDLLAPGAMIQAAGLIAGGTSQAAPHVSGAIALLASHFPTETTDQWANRLITTGVAVTDSRNNIITPRIDLVAAAFPANDNWGNAATLTITKDEGSLQADNRFGTAQINEPDHAGVAAKHSMWYEITVVEELTVELSLSTDSGQGVLAIYMGTDISNLVEQAATSGSPTSSLTLTFQPNMTYWIVVDNSTAGDAFNLSWQAVILETEEIPLLPVWAMALLTLLLLGSQRRRPTT